MIEKLEWDSEFFGYSIGRIVFDGAITADKLNILRRHKGFRLVYVFSENSLPSEFSNQLVDRKIIFQKKLSTRNGNILTTDFDLSTNSYGELIKLAYLSGRYSRFKADHNFINNEFHRLYERWIQNCLNDENLRVLVIDKGDSLAGFITVEPIDNERSKIGLISVNENFQGRGLGSALIKMSENVSLESGHSIIQVATQFDNKTAIALYEKNGFETLSSTYIYHLWST
jgi:dTDP-4-amino-4,6-dideoxy-D-galactose acyltransferase